LIPFSKEIRSTLKKSLTNKCICPDHLLFMRILISISGLSLLFYVVLKNKFAYM